MQVVGRAILRFAKCDFLLAFYTDMKGSLHRCSRSVKLHFSIPHSPSSVEFDITRCYYPVIQIGFGSQVAKTPAYYCHMPIFIFCCTVLPGHHTRSTNASCICCAKRGHCIVNRDFSSPYFDSSKKISPAEQALNG